MLEVRIHARGGQGAVIAEELLVHTLVLDGWHATGVPIFGFERRGAPVTTFVRLDRAPIRHKTLVYNPHALIVLDPTLIRPELYDGLQEDAWLIVNTDRPPAAELLHPHVERLAIVDATRISVAEFGRPIPNTTTLAAAGAAIGWFRFESLAEAIRERWSGQLREANLRAARLGFESVQVLDVEALRSDLAQKG